MSAAAIAAVWDYAILEHKVFFDPLKKLIYVMSDVDELDVRVDLYSDAKEWQMLNPAYRPPIRAIGGDPTTQGGTAGTIFFTTNGWRLAIDHTITISGVLFSDDYPDPIVTVGSAELIKQVVANLVDNANVSSVEDELQQIITDVAGIPTAIENADATVAALNSAIQTLSWLRRRMEGNEVRTPTQLTVTDKDTAEVLVDKVVGGSQQTTTITISEP